MINADGRPTSVVYRTVRLTRADVGETDQPDASLLDQVGRPLLLAYGFVCPNVEVVSPDAHDLEVARDLALNTYRRFYASEDDFHPEFSRAYRLRSRVAPVDRVATPQSEPGLPAPWSSDPVPATRPPERPYVSRVILGVAVTVALIGLLSAYVFARQGSDVDVPNVVGMPVATAERALHDAGLGTQLLDQAGSALPGGVVVRTDPAAGQRVDRKAVIRLWVSAGTEPTTTPTPPGAAAVGPTSSPPPPT
jgi:hypothetical protein